MTTLKEGDKAPAFTANDQNSQQVSLSDFKGKTVVLYFYPKDDTPGCTSEACAFRDDFKTYAGKDAVILGISPDSPASHKKFKAKYDLNFTLLSDADKKVVAAYDVWKEKSMY